MSVCCECCVLSGRGLWDGLITRPEESYRPWCFVVCDLETLNGEFLTHWGAVASKVKKKTFSINATFTHTCLKECDGLCNDLTFTWDGVAWNIRLLSEQWVLKNTRIKVHRLIVDNIASHKEKGGYCKWRRKQYGLATSCVGTAF